jgi:6-phosphogluconolactonase (cycloisomerase 2 family)
LLVANNASNSINVFSVDPASGKLTPGEAWLPINQPSNSRSCEPPSRNLLVA